MECFGPLGRFLGVPGSCDLTLKPGFRPTHFHQPPVDGGSEACERRVLSRPLPGVCGRQTVPKAVC